MKLWIRNAFECVWDGRIRFTLFSSYCIGRHHLKYGCLKSAVYAMRMIGYT